MKLSHMNKLNILHARRLQICWIIYIKTDFVINNNMTFNATYCI